MLPVLLLSVVLLQPGSISESPAHEPKLEERLHAKVEGYSLSEDSFLQALAKVSAEFEIPLGIEWVDNPKGLRRIKHSWRRVTPYQVLDSLVRTQPGYGLEVRNGVVHIFPRGRVKDKRNFLNLHLDKVEVENDFVDFASRRNQARIHPIISPPRPPTAGAGTAGSWATGLGDRRVSFRLVNVTVRDVLDKLCLSADFKVWLVVYSNNRTLTSGGFHQTLSVHAGVVAEDYRPVWDLLRWGYDPVSKADRPDWKPRTAYPGAGTRKP